MPSSTTFRSVKAKIRVQCKQRRIRLEEFMKTFDVHHVKKIRVDQFKRALDGSGLGLAQDEVDVILAKYRKLDEPLFVDYRRFCDLIDKAFTVKGLEAQPELRSSIHVDLARSPVRDVSLSMTEQTTLETAKRKLARAIHDHGLVLKDVFHDFDKSNAGRVTRAQFVRDLLDIVVLSSAEVDAIVKAYGTALDVNYRALHYDLTGSPPSPTSIHASPYSANSPPRRVASAPATMNDATSRDTNALRALHTRLIEMVQRDRIRTKNFFTDFDALRTGKCTSAQFRRSVQLCFRSLTEDDLDLLVERYMVPDGSNKVDYISFCQHVEGKTSEDGEQEEQDALSVVTAATLRGSVGTTKCSRDLRGALRDDDEAVHRAAMQRLSTTCSQRRLLVKPVFQDFDKGHREHVTTDQFLRVLNVLQLPLASENERRVLLARYHSIHGDRFVNYVAFCYDLEHWLDATDRPSSSSGASMAASEILSPMRVISKESRPSSTTSAPALRSLPMLMRYIQQTIKRDRIRLEEYYRDFDKLRHGQLTATQFAAGLNTAGLVLQAEEVDTIATEYAVREMDTSTGKHWVAWQRFVDDVESVFTKKGLERTPQEDLAEMRSKGEQFGGAKKAQELTRDEEITTTRAMIRMKQAIDRQRLEISAAFEDFDRAKQGFVSETKFARVLSRFALLPEASTSRLLAIKFREQSSAVGIDQTLSSICDVNYRAFLHALEVVGDALSSGISEPSAISLPGSLAYRQRVYATGASTLSDAPQRSHRTSAYSKTDVRDVLTALRCQIVTKRIRLKEFITEGDKLRLGHITVAKFHTALNRSGCVLDECAISTLTDAFRSPKHDDMIDWRAFMEALEQQPQLDDEAKSPCQYKYQDCTADFGPDMRLLLGNLRTAVSNRRLQMKPYFQDYDPTNVCRVTRFQFAAILDMMKLPVTPQQLEMLQKQFAMPPGTGKDINYVAFLLATDSEFAADAKETA